MVTGIPGSFLTERPREAAAPPCRGPLDSRGPGRRRHCRRDRSRRRCPRWDAAVRRGCGSWSPGSPGRRGWWFSAALLAVFGLGQSPYMWDTHWYGPVVVVMIGAAVAERGGDGKWVPRPLITADPHRGAGRVGSGREHGLSHRPAGAGARGLGACWWAVPSSRASCPWVPKGRACPRSSRGCPPKVGCRPRSGRRPRIGCAPEEVASAPRSCPEDPGWVGTPKAGRPLKASRPLSSGSGASTPAGRQQSGTPWVALWMGATVCSGLELFTLSVQRLR